MRPLSVKRALLFAGLVIASGTASATAPFEYDCDTAAGSYSELKQAGQAGRPIAVRGTVVARQFRNDKRWLPGAAISVRADDGDMIMLRVAAMERGNGPLSLQLLTKVNGKDEQELLATVPADRAISFSIVPAADGFGVTLGDQQRRIAFAQEKSSATAVTCSTGEFLFTDLRFGD